MRPSFPSQSSRRVALIALLAGAVPVHAQDSQSNKALPQTIPGLDNFSIAPGDRLAQPPRMTPIPTPAPTPVAPPPAVQPAPRPLTIEPLPAVTPTPRPAERRPAVAPTRSPATAPTPPPEPIPTATTAPIVQPTSEATAPPVVTATPTPPATALAPAKRPSLLWIAVLIALLILPGALVVAWFYRRALADQRAGQAGDDRAPPEPTVPLPPTPAEPEADHTPRSTDRPRLEVAFQPRRAGTNLTSAAVDYRLIVRNTGTLAASDVRLGVGLVTAGNDHDERLKALFEQGVERPVVPPFDLDPGAEREVKAMVMLPRDAITVVTVKGRPMFVPMVAVNALYRWNGGSGQTATSHVVGIERAAGERMRPFWLDVPARMHDVVSERPHAVTVRR